MLEKVSAQLKSLICLEEQKITLKPGQSTEVEETANNSKAKIQSVMN